MCEKDILLNEILKPEVKYETQASFIKFLYPPPIKLKMIHYCYFSNNFNIVFIDTFY